jgi:hypothetical protein
MIGMRNASTFVVLAAVLLLLPACTDLELRTLIDDLSTKDPEWRFFETMESPASGSDIHFGAAVAVNHSFIVVGAPGENGSRGAVYIYPVAGGQIGSSKKLTVAGAGGGEDFGAAVAITRESGINRVVVGAPGESSNQGAVYLFEWDGSDWQPLVGTTGKLNTTGISLAADDSFGYSVAISGSYILIGSPGYDTLRGIAYIFDGYTTPDPWRWRTTLSMAGPDIGDIYGDSVAVTQAYAFIGAPGDETASFSTSGTVFVFSKDTVGDGWSTTTQGYVEAGDPQNNGYFGAAIDAREDLLLVGAPESGSNAAYVFERDAANWNQAQKLPQPDGAATDGFGTGVGLYGDFLAAAAPEHDYKATDDGAAYLFQRESGTWAELRKLTVNSSTNSDGFGSSLAVHGSFLVVGVPKDDENGSDSGSVYIYKFQ